MSKFIVYKGEPGKSASYVKSFATRSDAEARARKIAADTPGIETWVYGAFSTFENRTVDETHFVD